MLTKVIIYAYTQRIYSSRQIAKAVRENIPFMRIAGRQRRKLSFRYEGKETTESGFEIRKRGFRRFLLRGLPKVSLEVGWLSLNGQKTGNGGAGMTS